MVSWGSARELPASASPVSSDAPRSAPALERKLSTFRPPPLATAQTGNSREFRASVHQVDAAKSRLPAGAWNPVHDTRFSWEVALDGWTHVLEVLELKTRARIEVWIDHRLIWKASIVHLLAGNFRFIGNIGRHVLEIAQKGLGAHRYDLAVDGIPFSMCSELQEAEQTPRRFVATVFPRSPGPVTLAPHPKASPTTKRFHFVQWRV
mmetsp:Transcript_35710/g.85950  ORF Transcript_35710/g.85950 Transcript_35710/m.85950 type:complete len:207 (-) Transcript_35710:85-705(-)